MNVKSMFPSGWLKAADIPADITLTIGAIELEEVADEMRPVMRFNDHEKALVVNRTNADVIAGLYGEDTDNWLGKRITVGTETVKYKNQSMLGVRVRPFVSVGATGGYPAAIDFADTTMAAIMLRLRSFADKLKADETVDGGGGLVAAFRAAREFAAGKQVAVEKPVFAVTNKSNNAAVYAAGRALLIAANGGVTGDEIPF